MSIFGGPGGIPRPDLGLGVIPSLADPGTGSIAFQAAPLVQVPQASGFFRKLDWSSFAEKNVDQKRGEGQAPKLVDFSQSEQSYLCIRYALSDLLEEDTLMQMGGDKGLVQRTKMQLIMRQIALAAEERVAAALSAGITNTSSPSVKWDASASTTIRTNFDTADQSIIDGTYAMVRPNAVTMDYKVMHALRKAPELTGLQTGAVKYDEITEDQLFAWFRGRGYQYINISYTGAFGENVYVHYVQPNAGSIKTYFGTACCPYVGSEIKVWEWMEKGDMRYLAAQIYMDEIVTHAVTGYKFTNTLT